MASSDEVPIPLGNRFAVITNDDHTGIIWVVSILCLIYTLMVFLLRLEARRKNFGLDDILAVIGTLFASIQYILVFVANKKGFGKSHTLLSASDVEQLAKYNHASQVILLLALGLAKCSVIALCRRLFSAHLRSHRILCDVGMGLCAAWSIASVLAITVNCHSMDMLGYEGSFCQNLVPRWTAIGILDAVTEIAIVAMAFEGLWPLQMSLSRKLQAMATFLLRLVIIAFAGLHISTLRAATASDNVGVAMTTPAVYLQVELLYGLLSASVPALNRWLRNFDTSIGMAWLYNSQAYENRKSGSMSRSGNHAIALESIDRQEGEVKRMSRTLMKPKSVSKRTSAGVRSSDISFVPPGPRYSVTTAAYAQSQNSDTNDRPTSTGMESDEMIIRKDVQWHVQYEHESPSPRI